MMNFCLILLILLIVICAFYWKSYRYYALLYKIPSIPNWLPIIGHAQLCTNVNNMLKQLISISTFANSKQGVVKFWLGPYPVIVITNPEDAEIVLNSCLNKSIVYKFTKSWLGNGLITANASIWKSHIKKITPAFKQKVLDGFLDIFNEQSSVFVKALSKKAGLEPFNIYPYIGAANLETVCQTAMGTAMDLQSERGYKYQNAAEIYLHMVMKRACFVWLHSNFLFNFSKMKKIQDTTLKLLHGVSNEVISKKKAEFKKSLETKQMHIQSPLLDHILELNRTASVFTDQEIREQVDTFIIAGQETTSHVLLYTLLMLGSHIEVQDKVYQEIKEVLGDSNVDVKKEDLSKLVYLETVIKETMRLYPVVPGILRYIDKELQLNNYTIPKRCNAVICIWGINRHERWGKDYDSFRPERFFEVDSVPDHPASFATFSYGRRVCIGRHYAMMSMKTTLCHLLRRYKLFSDISQLELVVHFVMKPVSGYNIRLELR